MEYTWKNEWFWMTFESYVSLPPGTGLQLQFDKEGNAFVRWHDFYLNHGSNSRDHSMLIMEDKFLCRMKLSLNSPINALWYIYLCCWGHSVQQISIGRKRSSQGLCSGLGNVEKKSRKCRKDPGNVEKIQEVLIRSRGGRVTQMICQQRSVTIGDYFTTDVSRKTRHYVQCIKWHRDTEHSGSVSVPLFLC